MKEILFYPFPWAEPWRSNISFHRTDIFIHSLTSGAQEPHMAGDNHMENPNIQKGVCGCERTWALPRVEGRNQMIEGLVGWVRKINFPVLGMT